MYVGADRGQRATFRSPFPFSTMWSPRDWTEVIRFGSKCLYSESSGQPLCQFWQNFVCVLSVSRGQRSALGFFLSHFSTFVVSTYLFVQMSYNLFTNKQTPVILTKSAKSINSWKSKLKKKVKALWSVSWKQRFWCNNRFISPFVSKTHELWSYPRTLTI